MAEPTLEQLTARVARLESHLVPFTQIVYRSSTPRYATESDLLTGEGSRRTGGRWNPIGLAVVYLSLTPETAMAETLAHHRYFGIPIQEAMPRTFVAVDARLQSVLDMRDGRVRQRLQIAESQVLELDWRKESRRGLAPVTHRLGRAAHAAGLEGLIVPSTADLGQFNLLVFPDLLGSDSRLKVVNADQLK